MTTAFVIGNGLSRKDIDLNLLKTQGKIYGCNALYREFTPDVLIATDRPISERIQESGYAHTNVFYTRKPIPESGAKLLPAKYSGYSSGPNAIGLAAQQGNLLIYLLGFDMGPTNDNLFNNVYADTEFYKTSQHPPTFAGNWARQISQICKDYPNTQFVRISGETTAEVAELKQILNLSHQKIEEFLNSFLS